MERPRLSRCACLTALAVGTLLAVLAAPASAQTGPCAAPITNPIACENTKPGNPASEWDVAGSGSTSIQGYATAIGVDQGQAVSFKVDTPSSDYRLDIYRLGYYGGRARGASPPSSRRRRCPRSSRRAPSRRPGSSTAATGVSPRAGPCPPTPSQSQGRVGSACGELRSGFLDAAHRPQARPSARAFESGHRALHGRRAVAVHPRDARALFEFSATSCSDLSHA